MRQTIGSIYLHNAFHNTFFTHKLCLWPKKWQQTQVLRCLCILKLNMYTHKRLEIGGSLPASYARNIKFLVKSGKKTVYNCDSQKKFSWNQSVALLSVLFRTTWKSFLHKRNYWAERLCEVSRKRITFSWNFTLDRFRLTHC